MPEIILQYNKQVEFPIIELWKLKYRISKIIEEFCLYD